MHIVTVPAIRDFEFEGRRVRTGETVSVSPVTAAVLHFQGHVSLLHGEIPDPLGADLDEPVAPVVAVAHPPRPRKPTKKRKYQRRDLRA
jgi:hypothetical protein